MGEVRYVNLPEVLENSEKEYSDRAENGVDLNNSWVGVMGVVGVSRSLYEEKDISTESPGADHDGVAGMFWSQPGSGEKTPEGSSTTMASLSSCCASVCVCVCMHLNSLRGSLWKLHSATGRSSSRRLSSALHPGGIVLSDTQQTVPTNLEYFYRRVPSCRALRLSVPVESRNAK